LSSSPGTLRTSSSGWPAFASDPHKTVTPIALFPKIETYRAGNFSEALQVSSYAFCVANVIIRL